jgi:hypothetical protein
MASVVHAEGRSARTFGATDSGQRLLTLVVALSGAVLMSLEILGSRVLAPHYGSSVFVWGV